MLRRMLLLFTLALLALPLSAQNFTLEENIELEPFILPRFGVQGLRPASWVQSADSPGVFARARDPLDITALIVQSLPQPRDEFEALIVEQFNLPRLPESVETLATADYTWDIYATRTVQDGSERLLDIAITSDDERTYFVLLQTNALFYPQLNAELFLPVVESLEPIELYEAPGAGYAFPVPPGWSVTENEAEDAITASPADESVLVHMSAQPTEDPVPTLTAFVGTLRPDLDIAVTDNDVRVIDDAARLGGLDAVYLVDYLDGTTGFVLQGVARVYEGVSYMVVIDSTVRDIRLANTAISILDSGFVILALRENQAIEAESTSEAGSE